MYPKDHSVIRTLDMTILLLIGLCIFLTAVFTGSGFIVTFDSEGGTDVPSQNHKYGEYIHAPEPPEKQGYIFTGWYKDDILWNFENTTLCQSITLTAGWKKVTEIPSPF